MKLNFQNSERSGQDVIKINKLVKGYEGKQLLSEADLLVRYKEKVALIGANGSGKSTLIKLLLEGETADSGTAEFGASIKVGYLPQHIIFPDEDMTVLECFRDGITIPEGKAREYLSKFLFYGENVYKKVKSLSGGEKSRLKLSKLLFEDINLLILDEPTNHLDIDSIETLEEALEGFSGTILFVSHDRYFINKICGRVVALEDRKLVSYEGDYEYYRQKKSEAKQEMKEAKQKKKEKVQKVTTVDVNKKREKERLKLEADIEELEAKLKEIEKSLNSAADDYEKLQSCYNEKLKLQQCLDALMEEWVLLE